MSRLLPAQVLTALQASASPERAAVNFERLLQAAPDPDTALQTLTGDLHTLETLAAVLAGSQFLTEILLRNPGYLELLAMRSGLAQSKSAGQLLADARNATDPWLTENGMSGETALDALRRFQQRELLRIGAADLGGLMELASVTGQLSNLADAVVQTALEIVAAGLAIPPTGLVVIALGKLGGGELNYSSDIDLLFVHADSETGVDEGHAERAGRLAEQLVVVLTRATSQGFLYRVDVRLRPWGRVGPLAPSRLAYLRYLRDHARLWEKQALLRARPIAGDLQLGHALLREAGPLLFQVGEDKLREEVHGMKLRTENHLRETGRIRGEVKLGEGSIRDAEFVVQFLQLVHAGRCPELRTGNTLDAMTRLAEHGLLSPPEHRVLAEGYTFLRTVEHYLQILEYRQTHILPEKPADLRYLALRLGFTGPAAAQSFVARYEQHSAAVRAVYLRHLAGPALGGRRTGSEADKPDDGNMGGLAMTLEHEQGPLPAVRQHLARLAPSYASAFDPIEIERHAALASQLDAQRPVIVDAEPLSQGRSRVTIVGFDYLGELSVICGLMFAYGYSILDGHVYTYEPSGTQAGERKIIDVFTVRPVNPESPSPNWSDYERDLLGLVRLLQARDQRTAQGELAKRVAATLQTQTGEAPALAPVEIEIDNEASDRYTVLQISAPDTPGFLYEFTNALALSRIHISQVMVVSAGARVHDTLLVTNSRGEKIVSEARQRELRAATVLIKHFTHLLPRSPNPEAALIHFHEYLGELFGRPSWPDEFASLERPEVLNALAQLLGVSEFLWDDFLRMQYENLFPVVRDVAALDQPKSRAVLAAELASALTDSRWREALNEFKDREMFRIDMRHILGQTASFDAFARELTGLVEVVLGAAIHQVESELRSQHGAPLDDAGAPARFALLGLGKCGGCELGFASDIELMFAFAGNEGSKTAETGGPRVIPAAEYYEKLVVEVTRAIRARREGIFQIDLQLRPYGKAGSLATSLDGFKRYFAPSGPAWPYERQALVKLRAIAGDASLGQELERLRDDYLYTGAQFDVAAMRAMRERQLRHLVEAGRINAKFSKGGLVDLEYMVQGLQIAHGHREPRVRVTNTAEAIRALTDAGIISAENGERLLSALTFLQQLINALRMVRGNSKDLTVPLPNSEEFAFLARRLGYGQDVARLNVMLEETLGWVQRLEGRLLG